MFAGHRNQIPRWRMLGLGMNPLGFLPSGIAGLLPWYRGKTGTFTDSGLITPAVNNGDVVGGWQDQSGNGLHAIQATGAKKPTLTTNIINGKSVVRGDGVDDLLLTIATAALSGVTGFTIFLVCARLAAAADFGTLFENDTIAGNHRKGIRLGGAGFGDSNDILSPVEAGVAASGRTDDSPLSDGVFVILTVVYDGSLIGNANRLKYYFDGVQNTPLTFAGVIAASMEVRTQPIGVFSSITDTLPFKGDIAEVGLYDSALSTVNHNLLGNYLSREFNISWTNI